MNVLRKWWGCCLLAIFLAWSVPLFACAPVWPDVTFYDVCARNLLEGGVHYRDVFDTNLPGMPWLHALVRALFGYGTVPIRLVDVAVVGAMGWLLARRLRALDLPAIVRPWLIALVFYFYFSISEFNHVQRDSWMLLPILAAFAVRSWNAARMNSLDVARKSGFGVALLEGLLWGAAIWIKPFAIVPAATCWLVTAARMARDPVRGWRAVLVDGSGLLLGGLIAGGLGVSWLVASGAWPAFRECFFDWNEEYVRFDNLHLKALAPLLKLPPWGGVHLFALPAAAWMVFSGLVVRTVDADESASAKSHERARFGALYLGMLLQTILLQRGFDYQFVPDCMLGLAILAALPWKASRFAWAAAVAAVVVGAAWHPMFQPARGQNWWRCLKSGTSPQMRDNLALTTRIRWQDLARVKDWLKGQHLRSGELTCFDWKTSSLFVDLGLQPSTRYVGINFVWEGFKGHRQQILQELLTSRQKFIVVDLTQAGLSDAHAEEYSAGRPLALPPAMTPAARQLYPFSEPIVFRAGRYTVHRVTVRRTGK